MYVLFTFIGVVVMLALAYYIARKMSGNKTAVVDPRKQQQELDDFKQRAEQLRVPLRECEVISNAHTEEVLKSGNYRVQALDTLYDNGSANIKQVTINQSRVIFKTKRGEQEIAYTSGLIVMDRTTLLFRLDMQKETTLYIDKYDPSKFYFDLDFLQSSEE